MNDISKIIIGCIVIGIILSFIFDKEYTDDVKEIPTSGYYILNGKIIPLTKLDDNGMVIQNNEGCEGCHER